jgi:hypothetical protein
MDHTESKQLHISEVATVKCRLCATTMRRKNYKAHLKKIHPKANSEDLSGWTQPKISTMFKGAHVSQAVEPGPVQGQSAAAAVWEHQANEGLPGQVDADSGHPDCVSGPDLPAEGDGGGGELQGDVQGQQGVSCMGEQVGGAGVSSEQLVDDVCEEDTYDNRKRKADNETNSNRKKRFLSGDSAFSESDDL